MTIRLGAISSTSAKRIALGEDSIVLNLRRPTFAERAAHLGLLVSDSAGEAILQRIRTTVVGWDEVVDEQTGEPIPFSPEALEALCDQVPSLFNEIAGLSAEAYRSVLPAEEAETRSEN